MLRGYFFRRSLPFSSQAEVPKGSSVFASMIIALPLMGLSLLRVVQFFIDRAFLGHFGTEALASMQMSAMLVFSLLAMNGAFILGALPLIQKAVKANTRLVGTYISAIMILSLLIGAISSIASFMGIDLLCALFPNVSLLVQESAKSYLYCITPALSIYFAVMAMTVILQAFGETKRLFYIAFLSLGFHLFLDALLIFGLFGLPAMGTQGAAIASIAATCLQGSVLFACVRKKAELSCYFKDTIQVMKQFVSQSWASFVERVVQYGSYIGFLMMVSLLGTVATAAEQALIAIGMLCFIPADRLGAAFSQSKSFERNFYPAVFTTILFSSCIASVLFFYSSSMMSLFTYDLEVIMLGESCLAVMALTQPLMAMAVLLSDGMIATGNSKIAALVSFFGTIFIRFVACFYFTFVLEMGLVGIWWGIAVDWLTRCLLLGYFRASFKRTAVIKSL